MSTKDRESVRALGTLHAADGIGIVRLEDRFDTGIEELWSALTDPRRLSHWLGEVEGDFRQGGEFRARYFASGWEGNCRVEICDPPHRLMILTESADEPSGGIMEATLTVDGDQTLLVLEDRGVPLGQISAYGAGDQIHLEDLAAYLADGERCDAQARWRELQPLYEELSGDISR